MSDRENALNSVSATPQTAATASDGAGVGVLIVQALTRRRTAEAFVAGDRRLTYVQAADLVSRYTAMLGRRGVGLGTGVVMLSPNMPESWIVQAATYLLGARFTGLQALASAEDHIIVCADAGASVLVVTEAYEEPGRYILDEVDSLEHLHRAPAGSDPRRD